MSDDDVVVGTVFASRFNALAAQEAAAIHAERQKHLPVEQRATDPSAPAAVARRLASRDERERLDAARRHEGS